MGVFIIIAVGQHTEDFAETLDGRLRFDLQPGHSAQSPDLRRFQSPEEVSEVYANAMRNALSVDYCAELIGLLFVFITARLIQNYQVLRLRLSGIRTSCCSR